ncbi:CHAT domain-containing protein [Oricola sp.]|uniref:CHAT domain-containing protein n=1 Tax=Oricola sp. TaxID=1979950 RepID=UPI0025E0F714|nr:CHAT domain-containing protein [Oricola sp.]MCI5077476.1 CHAT domain-containing protein [Oricola sp.]
MTDTSTSEDLATRAEEARSAGDAGQAADLARRALALRDDTSGDGWHIAYRCLAMIGWTAGDLTEAERQFDRAVEHRRREDPRSVQGLVAALDDLAIARYYCGFAGSALELRREACRLAESRPATDPQTLRRVRRRLAQSCQSFGYLEEAESLYRQSRPEDTDSVEDRIGWTNAMALVAEDKGDVAGSARWFDAVIDILDTVQAAEGLAAALGNAIAARLELGQEREAAAQMRRLRHVCRTDRKLASQLALADSRIVFLTGRRRFDAAVGVALSNEGRIRAAMGDRVPADRIATRAMLLRLGGRPAEAIRLIGDHMPLPGKRTADHLALMVELAHLDLSQGAHDAARALLFEAMDFDIGDVRQERKWWLFSLLADAAQAAGKPRASILLGKFALIHLRRSARGLDTPELDGWLRPRMATYTKILNRLTRAGRDPEAVRLQLRRTQELSFDLASRRSASGVALEDIPFRPGEARLWARYQTLAEELRPRPPPVLPAGTPDRSERVRAFLEDIFEERFDRVAAAPSTQPETVRPGAHPLLTYLPCDDDRLRGVLLSPDGETPFDIAASADEIAGAIRSLRHAFDSASSAWKAPSRALHDAMIAPVADRIADYPRIDIVASGMIGYVPFPALHDGRRFLVETVATALRTGQPPVRRPERVSGAWKTAAFATTADNEVPGTVPEAQAIAVLSGNAAFIEQDFTPAALKAALASGINLLHVATHFTYQPGRPHHSRLLFGDGNWLSLAEIAGEAFDFSGLDLLVLSGCETGISDALDLGLEGLAGLLQAKGARQVIATLWRISDDGARRLMADFYDLLLSGQETDPVLALARAQRIRIDAMRGVPGRGPCGGGIGARRSLPDPGEWAGFAAFTR